MTARVAMLKCILKVLKQILESKLGNGLKSESCEFEENGEVGEVQISECKKGYVRLAHT